MGRRKAAVLPVPVCAIPRRSRPDRMWGIACCWMGVGWVNRISSNASSTSSDSCSVSNVIVRWGVLCVIVVFFCRGCRR